MNVCKFTKKQLDELNKVIKRELKKVNMHGMQVSNERLYMSIKQGEREEQRVSMICMTIQRLG